MQIIHKIDDFFYTIFPNVKKGDKSALQDAVQKYYTYGPYKPKVIIEDDWLTIEIDTPTILEQDADYKKVIALCERGKYPEAKPILTKLIEKNPTNSEYYRVMGQILSDEGDQEEAINTLIDALRWDSKNGWALLMMGNIFAKFKDDIPTAMKYYDQALIVNPDDNISINNIGANLMQQGNLQEAKRYFKKALQIDDQYPNTHFALGMIADMEADYQAAFDSCIRAIKTNKRKDPLQQNSVKLALEVAKKLVSDSGEKIYQEYRHKLEFEGDREIDLVEDDQIPTSAKFEFAENYDRDKHIIRYKPDYPGFEHLIMHELVHLEFVISARKEGLNQLFISDQNHKKNFIRRIEPSLKKLKRMGISDESIADYATNIFNGLNQQVFNTPIDLFIEQYLYDKFPRLRPYQFFSMFNMLQEGLKAVTDKKIVELSPADVLSKSKIYNLVNAMQFNELFGLDFIKDFNASQSELKQAKAFYDEYLDYKDDREPGEEYELVLHWAEDLKLDKNFELVSEQEYRSTRTNIDNLLESIEKDPFDMKSNSPAKEKELEKFLKSQKELGTNMAVVMYMVDALEFFKDKPKEEVKNIAFEIAMQGTQGYNPDKDNYRISAVKGKKFTGYHILAYYYVSWAIAIPEMLESLKLPYDDEYKLALTLFDPGKK